MTTSNRVLRVFLAAGLSAGLLAGCAGPDSTTVGDLPAFDSMSEAYAAVDDVLTCDPDPEGDPVEPMDGGALASEQELCLPYVQIDLYLDQEDLERALDIWGGSSQGEIPIVRGSNWMVVDLTDAATGSPTAVNLEALADELKAEYAVVAE